MKTAWTAEQLSRADKHNAPRFEDLLVERDRRLSRAPVSNEEIGLKFFRWLDYERRAIAQ